MSTPTPPPSEPGRGPDRGPSGYGEGNPPYPQQPPYGQQYPQQQPSYGQQYGGQYGQQQAQYGGYDPHGSGLPQASYQIPRDPDARPVTVAMAAWVTIALSVLTILGWVLVAFGLEWMLDEMARNPGDFDLSASDIQSAQDNRALIYAMVVGFIAASVFAIVLSVLVLRRQAWARIALVVMSSLTIITGLGMILSVVALLWIVAAASVIILLFTGGANEWFARRPDGWSTPYGTGSSSYQQPGGTYGEQGPPSGW
ncbi:hypothetical protein [Mumia zhuanghuii]|uniref:DUF4064 domain-containing protein n=1 Tax=Mumia zhuanghuii TaxID=2585211 RepID=A0A5C4N2G6_9ACTN|nr:hypothetical protein [Mumia zhuanghuii]TNC42910.1 hypothetical protein FHE65_19930 [Mumia zhuanghuii]TNC50678.1 hypothetical protein FHE65_03370 [Mumia zhuanghuii]